MPFLCKLIQELNKSAKHCHIEKPKALSNCRMQDLDIAAAPVSLYLFLCLYKGCVCVSVQRV